MTAIISACGTYRYRLERTWSTSPKVAFIMLNPSTADAEKDDPTIRRCVSFAKSWGYGGLIVGNLFALRSTDPKALISAPDPIGPDNDAHLRAIALCAERVVCAWGAHGSHHNRDKHVTRLFKLQHELASLGVTGKGQPKHPLYIAATTELRNFE
jgi:hypothetical protein